MPLDRTARILLAISALSAALFLPAAAAVSPFFAVSLKCAAIILLLLLAARLHTPRLLLAALACGVAGDFFLGIPRIASLKASDLFLLGLASFLIGHLFYITLFLRNRARPRMTHLDRLAVAAVIAVIWFVLSRTWPGLGPMRAPVIVYAVVLGAMAVCAQLSRFPALVSVGALFFVASDGMLACTHFLQPFPYSGSLVWFTYYIAQALITLGIITGTADEVSHPSPFVTSLRVTKR